MPDPTLFEQLQQTLDKLDTPERVALFSQYGVQYYADAAYLNLIRDALIELYTVSGEGDGQNNKGKFINFGYLQGESIYFDIINALNSITFEVSPIDTPVVIEAMKVLNDQAKKYRFLFAGGKGTWGANGNTVYGIHLLQLAPEVITVNDIMDQDNAVFINLGVISQQNFIVKANEIERDVSNPSKYYYFIYDADNKTWIRRFTGEVGFYGGENENQFDESDFTSITNSDVAPGNNIPNLQEITGSGNITTQPIVIYGGGYKVLRSNTGEEYTDPNGRVIRVIYPANDLSEESVIYEIPAKSVNDVFAMISDINGMTLEANQASAELYLKNAAGQILASINVGFLNNEGTTFFYNESTQMLELKDDQGNVLSSVPVSAFVSNLIQSVNFNGSTPYVLEFKDAENNVVDSVSFAISNIQGLQAALDGKMSTSHPANAITSGNISDWNTAYDALGNFVDKTTDQTIAGKKSWNGLQEYNSLSSRIFVNLQSGTGLRTFYDVTSYSSSSASVTGAIQVILPLVSNSATMWVAELTVIEYSTLALGNELSPAKFIITGYGDYLTNLSVWCSHPNRFSKVKFGRNTADDRTILIIEKYDNTFVRPKVTLDKVVYSYLDSNNVLLQNPSNYGINITTDVSAFVLLDTILNENFVRDNYYQSWVLANAVTRTTDQYAVNAIQGKKEWIGKQLITTRTIQKFGQNDNNFIRRLEYPSIYNPQSATVNGNIRIELPLTTSTMWSMKVTVIEYRSASPSNLLSPAEFIITGYGNNTVANKSVWCSNPDRFTQVRFGRNTADNASVIYIDKAESFQYPKVIIEYIDFHYNSSSIYDDAAFPITITTDNSNFVSNGTITNTDFVRDSFFLNNAVSNSYLKPSNTQIYGAGGESLNNLPIGSYIVALSTNATDKPFNSLGGLISVGALNGQGFQLLGSRLGSELWFRSFSTTYGAWIRLWNSGDFSAADVANWNTAYNHSQQIGNPHGTGIGDISGLQDELDDKAGLSDNNTFSGNNEFTEPVVIAPAVNDDEAINLQQLKLNRPYGVYSVLLTQSGTSAPTAIVLQNDVAFSLTWSYVSVGVYRLNFGITVPNDRCFVLSNIGTPGTITNTHEIRWTKPTDQNYIQINTLTKVGSSNAAHSDGLLSKASFEVRFYY